ncbi:MAG: GIY-YIG nuclease family protein, partial [Methylocystis sp.]|nr:GIY-YIG nuclease family protein [Methylocystis sp.]
MRSEARGFIYEIRCEEFVKIGKTMEPEKRVATLRLHNPLPLLLVAFRSVPHRYLRAFELHMHKELSPFHHQGEWFKVDSATVRGAIEETRRVFLKKQRLDGRPQGDYGGSYM